MSPTAIIIEGVDLYGRCNKKSRKIFTYTDYATWSEDKRFEIICGKAHSMAPAPSERHQGVSGELYYGFKHYLVGKKCKVYFSPFDVAFPEEGETFETSTNVVQPDIVIICDKNKIIDKGCSGPPDLIVEVLSPSTAPNDMKDKRRLYQRFLVKEYWIVDPIHKIVQVYKLDEEGKYSFPEIYSECDKIKVGIFNNELEIDLSVVLAE